MMGEFFTACIHPCYSTVAISALHMTFGSLPLTTLTNLIKQSLLEETDAGIQVRRPSIKTSVALSR